MIIKGSIIIEIWGKNPNILNRMIKSDISIKKLNKFDKTIEVGIIDLRNDTFLIREA